MSNEQRFRGTKAHRNLVQVPVASATVIEKGDFVILVSGYALTPTLYQTAANGNALPTTTAAQSAIALLFIGIAESASAVGETVAVVVDVSTDSQYEFDQATAAGISFGTKIEIATQSFASASYGCLDSTIVAGSTNPIAVCTRRHSSATVKTYAKLFPTLLMDDPAGQS